MPVLPRYALELNAWEIGVLTGLLYIRAADLKPPHPALALLDRLETARAHWQTAPDHNMGEEELP